MTNDPDSVSLADAVRHMAALGAPPDLLEEEIVNERPWLDSEHRAALWLLAWCVSERPGAADAPVPPGSRRTSVGGAWLEQATSRL